MFAVFTRGLLPELTFSVSQCDYSTNNLKRSHEVALKELTNI